MIYGHDMYISKDMYIYIIYIMLTSTNMEGFHRGSPSHHGFQQGFAPIRPALVQHFPAVLAQFHDAIAPLLAAW
jgi:hypothetical protein